MLKNRCSQIGMLEKSLESPLDKAGRSNQSVLKEINPEHSFGGLITEAEAPIFLPPDVKNRFFGKHPDAGKD